MSPTNEASIQNRITEYLAHALGTDGFFAKHKLGARPTYHRTFSPPISKQGTDLEKVAGDHQYDLAQTFFDRPPFVLEIKTTDQITGALKLGYPPPSDQDPAKRRFDQLR